MLDSWKSDGLTTIPAIFRDACRDAPDCVFLDFSGTTFSFSEARREVLSLANGLIALGVKRGDRICAILDNGPEAVFTWFAASEIGAVHVPINTDYKGEYLRHQIADSEARFIITETLYLDRIHLIADRLPDIRLILTNGEAEGPKGTIPELPLASIRAQADEIECEVGSSDLAMLIYTSGTSGPSKGCMVPHSYACNFAVQNQWHTQLRKGDILWTPGPLFHATAAFGVVLNAVLARATASVYPRFSVSNFWPEIERSRATHVSLVSVMLTLIPKVGATDASRRCFGQIKLLYGAPVNDDLKREWKALFGIQHVAQPGYGMTEACMITVASSYEPAPNLASGKRNADFEVRIIDDHGNECPVGVPGEIIVRPRRPGIMFSGYWKNPEATVAATRDLWFHTGDIGTFDEDEFFFFLDRKKDYLRKGGENISSFEVESTFRAHSSLSEIAVHSVASELSEDELKVTAVLKEGHSLSEEELCRWSIERLPHFAVPRFIEFRSVLPTTPTGKVQKHLLRADGVTQSTWDRTIAGIIVQR